MNRDCVPNNLRNYSITKLQMLLVVDDPFALQLLKKKTNVRANLLRIRLSKLFLQLANNLAERAGPVATFKYLQPRPLQFDGAFGEEDYAILVGAPPSAAGGEARLAVISGGGISGPRFGRRPAEAIPAARRRNTGRRVVPTGCRTCRAEPGSPVPAASAYARSRTHS